MAASGEQQLDEVIRNHLAGDKDSIKNFQPDFQYSVMEELQARVIRARREKEKIRISKPKTSLIYGEDYDALARKEGLLLIALQEISVVSGLSIYSGPPTPISSDSVENAEIVQMDTGELAGRIPTGKRQREEESDDEVPKRLSNKNKTKLNTPSTENSVTNSVSANPKILKNLGDQNQAPVAAPKKEKIPPFFVVPPANWHMLLIQIKNIVGTARCTTHKNFVKIQVSAETEYKDVQRILQREKVPFRSYLLDSEKNLKYVIRGLPANTNVSELEQELGIYDIPGLSVTQLYRGPASKRALLPLFLMKFPKTPFVLERVMEITDILGLEVSFEKFRGRKGPNQCHNCQGFFHSAAACHLLPNCVKCAGRHKTADCPKAYEDPCNCVNCGGNHPASYRSCPRFPKSAPSFKKFQKQKSSQETFSAQPARKVDKALSYAKVTAGQLFGTPTPPIKERVQNSPAPQIGAHSAAGFMEQVLLFEKSYKREVIVEVFQKSIQEIADAPTDFHRHLIMYTGLVSITRDGNRD